MSTQIQSQDLEGGVVTPGNNKYYGTEWTGTKWFQDLATVLTALGYTTWGTWATVPNKTAVYNAGATIAINDHLSYWPYTEAFVSSANVLKSASTGIGSVTINYWEAFNRPVTADIRYATPTLTLTNNGWGGDAASYSLTAKIYAIAGAYWSTAVDSWAALRTSATLTWTVSQGGSPATVTNPTFTFPGSAPLAAGQYAVKIEGTMTRTVNGWGSYSFSGSNTGWYSGNAIDLATPIAGSDLWFDVTSFNTLAVLGDASNVNKLAYIGKATTVGAICGTVTAQIRWAITEAWATSAEELWYLSDAPWVASSTIWTNVVFIGKGIATNSVSMRWLADFDSTVYSSITQNQIIYTAWGGILDYSVTIGNPSGSNPSLSTQISDDQITWNTIGIAQSWAAETATPNCSYVIPASKFVRLYWLPATGWTISITKMIFIPF